VIQSISEVEETAFDDSVPRGIVGCHVYFKPKFDLVGRLNEIVRLQKWDVVEFQQEKLSLEESFIRLTRSTETEEESVEQESEEVADEEGGAE
jgi:hypothetical protein